MAKRKAPKASAPVNGIVSVPFSKKDRRQSLRVIPAETLEYLPPVQDARQPQKFVCLTHDKSYAVTVTVHDPMPGLPPHDVMLHWMTPEDNKRMRFFTHAQFVGLMYAHGWRSITDISPGELEPDMSWTKGDDGDVFYVREDLRQWIGK